MDFNRLSHSGLRVSALGFGTATFGSGNDFFKAWGSPDAAGASRLIDVCLDHGVSLFDSADVYSAGLAEQILSEAIKGKRNRVLISTKTTFPIGAGPDDFGSSRQHILEALALETGRTVPPVALNWLLHRPTVSTVIVGAQRGAAHAEHRRGRMAAHRGAGGGPRCGQRGHAGLSGLPPARLPHAQRAGWVVTGRG